MKYITALLVALVALVGVGFGQVAVDANVAASGNYAGQDNYNSQYVNVYTGGYGGYYDPYYYGYYGYGGQSPIVINQYSTQTNVGGLQASSAIAVDGGANGADGSDGANGADGADGANGADGADGANGADGADAAPVTTAAPVYSGPVSANGMQIVNGGDSLAEEQMEILTPLEYVTYLDYNVLVVETRGVAPDVAQKFAISAIANHGYKAVYFVQGLIVYADGTVENKTLDLSSPPRVARSLGYL
jgi:hypothetical protein